VVTWAGHEQADYVGVYYLPYEGELVPVQFYYPDYYRTTLIRLYNFDGRAVTDETAMVVSYDEKTARDGTHYKQITNIEEFPSYQEALDYIAGQESGNHDIVGTNPFVSPVPLAAVRDYRLVYSSESGISQSDLGLIPEVKIFEYIPQE